jgi:hypothetical protein
MSQESATDMMYCPYTNTSPPECYINKVIELSEEAKALIKKALSNPERKACIIASDQAMLSCDICTRVLNEDEYSVKVSLESFICSAGCWGYSITVVIPKKLLE